MRSQSYRPPARYSNAPSPQRGRDDLYEGFRVRRAPSPPPATRAQHTEAESPYADINRLRGLPRRRSRPPRAPITDRPNRRNQAPSLQRSINHVACRHSWTSVAEPGEALIGYGRTATVDLQRVGDRRLRATNGFLSFTGLQPTQFTRCSLGRVMKRVAPQRPQNDATQLYLMLAQARVCKYASSERLAR
jgi:hypothetical protein